MSESISPRTRAQFIDLSPATDAPPNQTTRARIDSIDLLRGIVMVVMMLDHTRDFVHSGVFKFDPTDLSQTTLAVFLTRWITHFCAPVFVFLAGTSIYLQFARGKSKQHLSGFLLTRGLWLILLEFTVVRVGMSMNFDYRFLGAMQVIWVIGASMIVMAGLIHLPVKIIGPLGVAMIALHNLMDGIRVPSWRGPESVVPTIGAKVWMILHQPFEGFPILGFPSPIVFVIYPLIPWVGVMAAGYAFGTLYKTDPTRRRKLLLKIGGVVTLLFLILRAINKYGDPSSWANQKNLLFTILSFFNTTKYPPSLLFLLMTLGPSLLALAAFETWSNNPGTISSGFLNRLRNIFITFGRVPLFFYLLQWPTAKLISLALHFAFGKPVAWMFQSPISQQGPTEGIGFRLWVVYLCWLLGVALLYPLCKWFAVVKQRRRDWWLSYL